MISYRRLVPSAAIVATVVSAALILNSREVEAQGPPPVQVRVIGPLPLPVQDVTVATRTPFQTRLQSPGNVFDSSFTMPGDQRLTIEFVTITCEDLEAPVSARLASLSTKVGGNFAAHSFSSKFAYALAGAVPVAFYSSSEPVRIYADPGTFVDFNRFGSSPCVISLSGFTESVGVQHQ